MTFTTAYLCLGSNIEPKYHLSSAVQKIQADFKNSLVSSVYQTPAQGFEGEDFLNLAIEVNIELSLAELLVYTDKLEQMAGRVRVKRGHFDDRTLDVDVVIYGDLVGHYLGRNWPSEDLTEYAHVLMPLAQIAPQSKHPKSGHTFQQLWNQFKNKQQIEVNVNQYDQQWLEVS